MERNSLVLKLASMQNEVYDVEWRLQLAKASEERAKRDLLELTTTATAEAAERVELKNLVNELKRENSELTTLLLSQRYSEHPGNLKEPPEGISHSLKVKLNLLANENDDLKYLVGKLRYSRQPGSKEAGECHPLLCLQFRTISTSIYNNQERTSKLFLI